MQCLWRLQLRLWQHRVHIPQRPIDPAAVRTFVQMGLQFRVLRFAEPAVQLCAEQLQRLVTVHFAATSPSMDSDDARRERFPRSRIFFS